MTEDVTLSVTLSSLRLLLAAWNANSFLCLLVPDISTFLEDPLHPIHTSESSPFIKISSANPLSWAFCLLPNPNQSSMNAPLGIKRVKACKTTRSLPDTFKFSVCVNDYYLHKKMRKNCTRQHMWNTSFRTDIHSFWWEKTDIVYSLLRMILSQLRNLPDSYGCYGNNRRWCIW